jgi:mono/diheme cytochrome c family protein
MRVLKWLGIVFGVLMVAAVGGFFYLKSIAQAKLDKQYDVKVGAIPIPFPLSKAEVDALARRKAKGLAADAAAGDAVVPEDVAAAANPTGGRGETETAATNPLAGVDLKAIALRNATRRGEHYMKSRAGCTECHGDDLGGKVIVESTVMGKWVAPNITRGGVTKSYRSEDWVRLVRHGLKPDKKPAIMPSTDYASFSDQEISDIATYINSVPSVDRVMPPTELGIIYTWLIAKGEMPISAEVIDHQSPRPKYPPAIAATEELGKHLATVCSGCHGATFSGGDIPGGDPKWPAAQNITFHETGLNSWTLEQFQKALKEGVRPDGSKIDPSMPVKYTANFRDAETEALYMYLKTVKPLPFGNR